MSLKKSTKSVGDKTPPWGTPWRSSNFLLFVWFRLTLAVLLYKYASSAWIHQLRSSKLSLVNHQSGLCRTPFEGQSRLSRLPSVLEMSLRPLVISK
ncbi:hypothetical protein DPMN_159734 [Dreissena polymorpha]|uniref:Uncharacterized protein n=1 Tax=Dreissena polymorpha TaxID=45954 RepID=A0A9D4EK82_DREPO|nr:hypothetical protein DPMN_159734 [Dreissena polymorpha]